YGKESVSINKLSSSKRQVHKPDHQHRVKTIIVEPYAVDHLLAKPPEAKPRKSADQHLAEKKWDDRNKFLLRIFHKAQEKYGEHIRHRVVAATLQFECRSEIARQCQAL